jgi:serine protease Do
MRSKNVADPCVPSVRSGPEFRRLATALALILAFAALSIAQGQPTEIVLKNGATIRADALQRTGERIVLDLGYTVLTVPADQVASEGAAAMARLGSGLAGGTSETLVNIASAKFGTDQPGKKESFDEMIDRLEQGVVIVSNPQGLGAGFVIDAAGLLVTNYHVVRGEKYQDVTVFLKKPDGKTEKTVFHRVEVLAFSPLLDCALLRIAAKDLEGVKLPALALAEPSSVKTGTRVFAIGNPGVGAQILDHTVSQGILSSSSRNFNDILYLQTTAAVNPGNSGGPLLNDDGEVVGLVTFRAIFQEGLAFALPVWYLRLFLDNARAYAPTSDDKNTGYRYQSPMGEMQKEKEKK